MSQNIIPDVSKTDTLIWSRIRGLKNSHEGGQKQPREIPSNVGGQKPTPLNDHKTLV